MRKIEIKNITQICENCNNEFSYFSNKRYKSKTCSHKCAGLLVFKNKVLQIDWNTIQKSYDKDLSIQKITNEFKLTRVIIKLAKELNLFKKSHKKPKISEETRNKMSKIRKEFLLNNPDKHPWRYNNKFISKPCETLKEFFKDNKIEYIEEYKAIKGYNYSIDIAFPDRLLGLEINGNQHYNNDGTLKDYYKKRENTIINNGWKIIQIPFLLCYNEEFKKEILQIIKKEKNINDFSYLNYKPKIKSKEIKIQKRQRIEEKRNNKQIKHNMYVELIKNSNIDFSKYGWVDKVSKLVNVRFQKINTLMKTIMPDFYNEKCFKRKNIFI